MLAPPTFKNKRSTSWLQLCAFLGAAMLVHSSLIKFFLKFFICNKKWLVYTSATHSGPVHDITDSRLLVTKWQHTVVYIYKILFMIFKQ